MTLARRQFLQDAAGVISGTVLGSNAGVSSSETSASPSSSLQDEVFSSSIDLELLGIPRSWWHVHHGLHPFSPERTIVLSRWQWKRQDQIGQELSILCETIHEPMKLTPSRQILQIVQILTLSYKMPERLKDWSRKLTRQLTVTDNRDITNGRFLSPQGIQSWNETVHTINGIVDWWLILIPDGTNADAEDGRLLHAIILPVFTQQWTYQQPKVFEMLMSEVVSHAENINGDPSPGIWIDLSRMDRRRACMTLNGYVAKFLQSLSCTSSPALTEQSDGSAT